MSFKQKIDIDLKARTVWLRNAQIINATCEDRASLFAYIAELGEKDADFKFFVDGLTVRFYCDIPLTSFFEKIIASLDGFGEPDVQEEIVRNFVIETLNAGLYEKILDIAKNALADSELQ